MGYIEINKIIKINNIKERFRNIRFKIENNT